MTDDLVKRLRRYGEWIREDRDPSLFTLVTDEDHRLPIERKAEA